MKVYPANEQPYIYIINDEDLIIQVSTQPWDKFYKNNSYTFDGCFSHNIIGHSIWNYLESIETRHLYKIVLENVRKYHKSITLPFRCDSPTQRRYLELSITPLEHNYIQFKSQIIYIENREHVAVWDRDIPKENDFMSMCSMCKSVKLERTKWVEIEEYLAHYKLFTKEQLPQISHSLCPKCYEDVLSEVNKMKED